MLAAGSAASKRTSEAAAEQSTPRSQSHCCRRSSLGRCLRCSADQSPDDCNPYETRRSSPGSGCPLLYLARGKHTLHELYCFVSVVDILANGGFPIFVTSCHSTLLLSLSNQLQLSCWSLKDGEKTHRWSLKGLCSILCY